VFGSIGGPEVLLLFIVALLLFGPRRLPEIGRTLGKALADFRRATTDFRMNLEREVQMEALKDAVRPIETAPPPAVLARGVLVEDTPAKSDDKPAIDGGPDSVH
jgi:Tat protein translocase TatB subunit